MVQTPFIALFIAFGAFGAFGALPTTAQSANITGFIAAEQRHFFKEEAFTGQKHGSTPSLILEPEVYHRSQNGAHSFVFKPFFRYDATDSKRTHVDLRQADWTYYNSNWEVRAGISRVFWGVAESRHLVDILNPVDGLEDIDEEDRLGQPMLQFANFQDWGTIRFFYLPFFRERTFVGTKGRLRTPLVVDTKNTQYSTGAKAFTPAFALRYEHTFGDWDLGLAHFHGLSREPTFTPQGNGTALPFYEIIDQTSVDAQYTYDAWLWKFEGLYRTGQNGSKGGFAAVTGGFEYTLFGIQDTDHDLGLLLEYHHDGRSKNAPATLFDDDVFIGARYALNNTADTQFLGGITLDTSGNGTFSVIEASHRINNNWKVEFDARFFGQTPKNSPFSFLNNEDFAQLRLSYLFN